MNIRKWIPILICLTLISFGVGIYSLIHYDNFKLSNIYNYGIIQLRSDAENINIDKNGIVVKDGKSNVKINWDGIEVRDGEDNVSIGWGGITVKEGGKTTFNLGNPNKWGINKFKRLELQKIDEEKFINIDGIDNIDINSQFVDVRVVSEDRKDVGIKFYGEMESNVLPSLDVTKKGNKLIVKIDNPNNSYTVKESDVVLEVLVPLRYNENISVSTSSADINMSNLTVANVDMNSTSGSIEIIETGAKSFNLATSSGDIESKGSVGFFHINTSSGDVDLSMEESKGDIKINTSSGNVNINYWISVDYNVTGTISSGDVYFNGSSILPKNNNGRFHLLIGRGSNSMEINTSSGEINFTSK